MLAQIVDRNRLSAAFFVAAGLLVPLGVVFSAGVTSLVTLRRGWVDGLTVGLLGFGVIAGLLAFAGPTLDWGVLIQGALLVAVVAMAQLLRQMQALAAALWLALAFCLSGVLIYWMVADDPVGYWQRAFGQLLDQFAARGGNLSDSERAMLDSLQWRGVTGHVFGCCFLMVSAGLFIGRGWQAKLVNPGGFRQEFHWLRLGRGLALGSAAVFMASGILQQDLLLNLAAVLIYVWMIAGFSVIHGLVGVLELGSGWLWLVYGLTVLTWAGASPLFLVVPLAGLVNEFVDLRRVAQRKKKPRP